MSDLSFKEKILHKIHNGTVKVGVIGLGYVGLPLALAFAKKGCSILGFDTSEEKVESLGKGRNYVGDVRGEDLKAVIDGNIFQATADFFRIAECDAVIVCVPTPLNKFKQPDMSFIEAACTSIGTYMSPGTFIALESTTYPTTTEKFMLPILEEKSGFLHGREFWLAYSPERVDPGNKDFTTENTPKLLGALSEEGEEIGLALYAKALDEVLPVSSPRVAEMAKILENAYRLVNISLVNELALLCGKMDIDIWEVIDAAKTKPFGFQPFYPGPGIGGHCIPLDPFYLEYIAREYDFNLTMIHAAGHIDTLMAHRMTIKITSALNRVQKPVNGSRILFIGAAYKPDIDDFRESPAIKIMHEVFLKGGKVNYYDPLIPELTTLDGHTLSSLPLDAPTLAGMDCVVITTNHSSIDWDFVYNNAPLIVDLRNAIKKRDAKVYKL